MKATPKKLMKTYRIIIGKVVSPSEARPSFVSFDENKMEGTLVRLPERDEMEPEVDEALIVEWYNKKL